MSSESQSSRREEWLVATIRSQGGDTIARFDRAAGFVLDDPKYSRAIWFAIQAAGSSNLNDHLSQMARLEDSIRAEMALCPESRMLAALTDAEGCELVFASAGDEESVVCAVRSLEDAFPDRFAATVLQPPQFGPYPALIKAHGGKV